MRRLPRVNSYSPISLLSPSVIFQRKIKQLTCFGLFPSYFFSPPPPNSKTLKLSLHTCIFIPPLFAFSLPSTSLHLPRNSSHWMNNIPFKFYLSNFFFPQFSLSLTIPWWHGTSVSCIIYPSALLLPLVRASIGIFLAWKYYFHVPSEWFYSFGPQLHVRATVAYIKSFVFVLGHYSYTTAYLCGIRTLCKYWQGFYAR